MKQNSLFILALILVSCLFSQSIDKKISDIALRAEISDTLTVIQKPLINIPAIVIPGESLTIECVAPQTTVNWTAQLKKNTHIVDMNITNSIYSTSPPRWVITATVPAVQVYELYDLYVTASGGISDRTKHSVQVLPSRKTSYYFAQVTDVHLPSPIFSPNTGYDTDSTSINDFREVVKDLNIIRPEFVVIIGDYINEGELEDYQNLHYVAKGKRIMAELEVPVYLMSGNHDIGGWTQTPPPAGSSRKFWWKYFGWSWLNNSSTSWAYHTQDYSFNYGSTHFTCLEGYLNYEDYLLNIYGDQSFTTTQMTWLRNDLSTCNAMTKVLLYHYDFSSQINLSTLGVQMALWGHMHSNSGSITSTPYNLGLKNCSTGNRAYRIVKVNNGILQPFAPCTAGSSGSQISIAYSPNNAGIADSIRATLVNNQSIAFENSLVKFIMPPGNAEYAVLNGTIEQVDRTSIYNVVYVKTSLSANSTKYVSLWVNGVGYPEEMDITVNNSNENATISWNSSWGHPLGYRIYRSTTSNFIPTPNLLIGTCPASQTSYIDVGVTHTGNYFYRVVSYK